MTNKQNYDVYKSSGVPVYAFTRGVSFDQKAVDQLLSTSKMPFVYRHIAVMPDVHLGIGCSVGSVIATKGAIIPAAVGVDIGCGMAAVRTTLTANDLPDNLHQVRLDIEAAVPHGRTDNGGKNDRGSWDDTPTFIKDIYAPPGVTDEVFEKSLWYRYNRIIVKHPKAKAYNGVNHLGTLGTGNHFIEVCLDESDRVWVMLHSGSRGPGNKIGQYFISKAKEEMEKYYISHLLPDKDLSYLVEHTELYDDYIEAVSWAQDFAKANREVMMSRTLQAMSKTLPTFSVTDEAVDCHHNYVSRENHFGANVLVTRKGAVRARSTDLGVIPGSMGTGSFITRGRGNPESFYSSSHGAGRVMSRTEAHKTITLEEHKKAMVGIEARLDIEVLDESPSAYKDISAVMKAQDSLVEIVHRLRQVVNVKG